MNSRGPIPARVGSVGTGAGARAGMGAVAGVGARKMVIKPFKVAPKVAEGFSTERWEKLKHALTGVYAKSSSLISKEELYRAVEDLCCQRMGPQLYTLLLGELQGHISRKVESLDGAQGRGPGAEGDVGVCGSGMDLGGVTFLAAVDGVWADHLEQLRNVRNIFLYLDRSYAIAQGGVGGGVGVGEVGGMQVMHGKGSKTPIVTATMVAEATATSTVRPIWVTGNDIFRQQLERMPDLQDRLVQAMLGNIEQFRLGYITDCAIVGRLARMLLEVRRYAQFEWALIRDSARFFAEEGGKLVDEVEPSLFLLRVEKRLRECADFSTQLLDESSRKPLLSTVESHLLMPHLHTLLERGLKPLLDSDRVEDLRRMYLLFGRVNKTDLLVKAWTQYCRSSGEALVGAGEEGHKRFVEEVLALLRKLTAILHQAFCNQESFKGGLSSSFEHFLNARTARPSHAPSIAPTQASSGPSSSLACDFNAASLLARFVDRKLRVERGVTEQEVETQLDQAMELFRYLQEKDIFEAFYKKHLAKRLLLAKSASYEQEKGMLSRLKTECGSNYTCKLEGMFQDVELSRECLAAFYAFRETKRAGAVGAVGEGAVQGEGEREASGVTTSPSSDIDIHVQVLTTGYWPSSAPSPGLLLPPEILALSGQFEAFYGAKYQGRRLHWAHSLERCVVSARFPRGRRDLEVSLFQALVLRCFNRADRLELAQVRAETGLELGELRRTLQSLACGVLGTRVLTKEPKGKEVADTDAFWFNEDYTNKLFRVKINSIQLKETKEETERTSEEVFRDREYQVDATIVRIMKSRKRLPHATLISELLVQLRFPAQTSDLKKRIESLIERDYLQRDEGESSVYNYLA